jgi:predicted DNA-binding transcriptional regulator AlpA
MRRSSANRRNDSVNEAQLFFAIEPWLSEERPRGPQQRGRVRRTKAATDIVWMSDVLRLTGRHRSTIHRWMHQGRFPIKNAPKGQPTGWLRSTIEAWLLGH